MGFWTGLIVVCIGALFIPLIIDAFGDYIDKRVDQRLAEREEEDEAEEC